MAAAANKLSTGLRMALRIATKLRQELPTNQLAMFDNETLDKLLQFELSVVFAHLLGRQLPDAPDDVMESSALLAHSVDRILEAAQEATRMVKPPVRYVVGNIWRWCGQRRFQVALAEELKDDVAHWKQIWTVYDKLTKLAVANKPPLFTWNELLSQGVRYRRPMGLVLDNHGITGAAGVFTLPSGLLTAGCDLGDRPHEDSPEQALDSLSSLGASMPPQDTADSATSRLSRIAGKSCEERGVAEALGAAIADLAASKVDPTILEACQRIFDEFGTVVHLEGVAFMFKALHRYYLQPWGARSFYSFPAPTLLRAEDRYLTSVLSVGFGSVSLEEKHLWMLELLESKILGPYLHLEVQNYLSRRDKASVRVGAENGLKKLSAVLFAAETAAEEIIERSDTVTVGNLCLPVRHLESVRIKFPIKRPENFLIGRLIIGGLAKRLTKKHKFSRLNLSLACGMVDPASAKSLLLLRILDEIEMDESLVGADKLAVAIGLAAEAEKVFETADGVLVKHMPSIRLACDALVDGRLPNKNVHEELKAIRKRKGHRTPEKLRLYLTNILKFHSRTPELDTNEAQILEQAFSRIEPEGDCA